MSRVFLEIGRGKRSFTIKLPLDSCLSCIFFGYFGYPVLYYFLRVLCIGINQLTNLVSIGNWSAEESLLLILTRK